MLPLSTIESLSDTQANVRQEFFFFQIRKWESKVISSYFLNAVISKVISLQFKEVTSNK